MNDFVAELKLDAEADGAVSEIKRESAELDKLGAAGERAGAGLDKASGASAKLDASVAATTAATTANVAATAGQATAHEAAAAAAGVQTTALGSLQAWVRQTSQDELLFAAAAREAAVAQQAAAAAAVQEAAAYAASTVGMEGHATAAAFARNAEIELAAATKLVTAAKEGEAVALARVTSASTVAGSALSALRMGVTGFVSLLGGPASIALLAAQGGFLLFSKVMGDAKDKAKELEVQQSDLRAALDLVVQLNREAAIASGLASGALDKEAAASLRAADASRQHADALREENKLKLQKGMLGAEADLAAAQKAAIAARMGSIGPGGMVMPAPSGLDALANQQLAQAQARVDMLNDKYFPLATGAGTGRRHGGSGTDPTIGRPGGAEAPAAATAAGHRAVASAATARASATDAAREAEQRLAQLKETADQARLETQLLKERAAAAMIGGQALEDLRVKEAGLQVLQQLHVTTLDQLSASERRSAEAAMAAAEARERQAIATQKAERVGEALRDLDKQITLERARTAAIVGGSRAMVDFAKAEAQRQAVERAGENLTAAEVAALKEKAALLFQIQAANDDADLTRQHEEALSLARLTNREHEIEIRAMERAKLLQAQFNDLSNEEALIRGRIVAMREVQSEETANAIGALKDSLRDAFIESGELGFDDVADYAKKKLRAAVYDALLAKPIDVMINAIVGGVSGLTGLAAKLGLGGLGAALGAGGTGVALGQAMGLGTGNGGLDMALGVGGAALGSMFAAPIATAVGSAVGAGLSAVGVGALGSVGASVGITSLLSSAAVMGPIAAIAVLAAATLFKKKPSNNGAQANLTDDGFTLVGDKRTSETTTMATNAANAVLQGEAMLKAAGITLNATVKSLDLGTRDATDIVLSDGRAFTSAVGDAAAAAETGLKAVLETATFKDDAQKALVQGLLAAGKGFDDIAAALGQLGAAQALPQAITEAIQKLTDPKAYEVGQLGKAQAGRRKEIEDAAAAGYLTAEQLAAVNLQLDRLEGLELDEVLKRFGAAAEDAAANLSADVNEGFLKILDPAAYQQARGVREINEQIEAMKATAQGLIASGELGADILGRIDALRDLQLGELAKEVAEITDTFGQARKGLRQWLDAMGMSASAELSPAALRDKAFADYQRVLAKAQGGDAEAGGQVTGYADRLFAADRDATDSAQARLALFNQVRAEIEGLANSPSSPANSLASALSAPLAQLLAQAQLTTAANDDIASALAATLDVSVDNIPSLRTMYGEVTTAQTDRLVAAIETLRTDLKAAIDGLSGVQGAAAAAAQGALEQALNAVSTGFNDLTATQEEIRRDGMVASALGKLGLIRNAA